MPESMKTYTRIEGLTEFIRDLGVAEAQMKAAERVFLTVAALSVASKAKNKAAQVGRQASKASIDVRATATPGIVTYGGQPFDMGAEFGAYQYKQFKVWRGNKDDAGYFFWPAIREFRDNDMLDLWAREVWSKVAVAFPHR